MTEKQRQKGDPAIRRVRAARHEISAEHSHDPKRVVDDYVERQQGGERGSEGTASDGEDIPD